MFNELNAKIVQLNAGLNAVNNLNQPPNPNQPLNGDLFGAGPFGGGFFGGGPFGGGPFGGGPFGGAPLGGAPLGGGLFGLGLGGLNQVNLFNGPQEGAIFGGPQTAVDFLGVPLFGLGPPLSIVGVAGGDSLFNWGFGTGMGAPLAAGHSQQTGRTLRRPNVKQVPTPPIRKNLYQEHSTTARRSKDEIVAFREANAITVSGLDVSKPVMNMAEAGFSEDMIEILQAMKCNSLSRLQAQCWPVALSGRDLLAIVETGTEGKTLSYLLPAIVHIRNQEPFQRNEGPIVLVLASTRESAQEIEQAARDFEKYTNLPVMCLSSGVPKEPQLKQLEEGAEICVATPGRLVAFMEDAKVDLRHCSYLVVDAADRMVAMGFEQQLRTIVENTRPDRQTIVWISSPSLDMEHLVEEMLTDHVTITIGASQSCQNQQTLHVVLVCDEDQKEQALIGLLKDICEEGVKVIVFVEMRQTVDELVVMMQDHGWPAVGIHKNKTEEERNWALQAFRLRSIPILVTTDVEACGLETDGVRFVINYDRPASSENYCRRVKHVARADGASKAYTFLAPSDSFHAKMMIAIFREAKQDISPELFNIAKGKAPSGNSRAT